MAAVEDQELDLGNSDVCTKYREAGRIANLAMQGIKTMVRASTALRLKSLCSKAPKSQRTWKTGLLSAELRWLLRPRDT